jgi:pimeloyl-ACP methyl ester carboxylesterase
VPDDTSAIREQRIELAGFGTRALELEPGAPTGEPPLVLLRAERVLSEIPGSRLELIADCGHCPQVEEPERLAELLAGFLTPLAQAA